MKQKSDIIDNLQDEIARCSELAEGYRLLGGKGIFALTMIEVEAEKAMEAMKAGDYEVMSSSYKRLKRFN